MPGITYNEQLVHEFFGMKLDTCLASLIMNLVA